MYSEKKGILQERFMAKGDWLANFLNRAQGSAQEKTVSKLYDLYRSLQYSLSEIAATTPPCAQVQGGPRDGALVYRIPAKVARLTNRINRVLARHLFRWQIPPGLIAEKGEAVRVETELYRLPDVRSGVRKSEIERGWTEDEYYTAIACVVQLANWDELGRLRRCGECSKWFMANRTDRVYHENCAAKRHRKQRAASGISTAYQKWYRKYLLVNDRRKSLEAKRGVHAMHLSKTERAELQELTAEAERLKDKWKTKLRTLKKKKGTHNGSL